jgi:diguanylate cyclase
MTGDDMAIDLELSLRGPDAYALTRKAVAQMEKHKVWPTPLNYELWMHYIASPESELAAEIDGLVKQQQPITEAVSEDLAARYLTRNRLSEEIRDAGDQLTRELASVTLAIEKAQASNAAYGRTLAGASKDLNTGPQADAVKKMVDNLAAATKRVQRENSTLEQRLSASTEEVERLRENLEQVRRDAMTDGLTNLANRKSFDEGLLSACAKAQANGQPVALAVIDIDHFKRFNDTWGHQTGDQVLRYVASVIGRVGSTAPRLAARYGGEEFALIFPGETAASVTPLLEEIREEIASRLLKRRSTDEDLGAVTISIGLAEREGGESATQLVERADAALYASKRGGRNRLTAAGATAKAA